jgi:hypothetical protein
MDKKNKDRIVEQDGSIKAVIEKKYYKNSEEYDSQPEKKKAIPVPKAITILTKKKPQAFSL